MKRTEAPNVKAEGNVYHHIIMDEFGQTPDHHYLATNSLRAPVCFTEVVQHHAVGGAQASANGKHMPKQGRGAATSDAKKTKCTERQRYDTSLGNLTQKFVQLLQESPDGVMNLNKACNILSVPKRRIYDITNVMEGIGVLKKQSRNNIQWVGGNCDVRTILDLKNDIAVLESKENQLDKLIANSKDEMQRLRSEENKYAFMTADEIQQMDNFSTQTLIGVKASAETLLEAHENYKIRLKSQGVEISAYLFTDEPGFRTIESKKNKDVVIKIENNRMSVMGEDPYLKNALITEEDDMAPMSKDFLLQTEDQDCDLPFVFLEPATLLDEVDYNFTLSEGEGITDLFDTCDFTCS